MILLVFLSYSVGLAFAWCFLPNFKPWGAGYESVYYGINNMRSTKSEIRNRDLAFIGPIYQEMYERAASVSSKFYSFQVLY